MFFVFYLTRNFEVEVCKTCLTRFCKD